MEALAHVTPSHGAEAEEAAILNKLVDELLLAAGDTRVGHVPVLHVLASVSDSYLAAQEPVAAAAPPTVAASGGSSKPEVANALRRADALAAELIRLSHMQVATASSKEQNECVLRVIRFLSAHVGHPAPRSQPALPVKDVVTHLVLPWLDAVFVGGGEAGNLAWARGVYARLAPLTLAALLRGDDDGASLPDLAARCAARYAEDACVQALLAPLLRSVVHPVGKALAYHFEPGRRSASPSEPQHFFEYLSQSVAKLRADVAELWAALPRTAAEVGVAVPADLEHVAQVFLAHTARQVFVETYSWESRRNDPEFVVHVVNCLADFCEAVAGRGPRGMSQQGEPVAQVLVDALLSPWATRLVLARALHVATEAYHNGAARLWRRHFVDQPDAGAPQSLGGPPNVATAHHRQKLMARHFVRAVTAFVRRFSDVARLQGSRIGVELLWNECVSPCLEFYTRQIDGNYRECETAPDGCPIALRAGCLMCAQDVYSAGEEWLAVCQEGLGSRSAAPRITSTDALDRLALWRDNAMRALIHDIDAFLQHAFGNGGRRALPAALDAFREEVAFLRRHALGSPPVSVVVACVRGAVESCLAADGDMRRWLLSA